MDEGTLRHLTKTLLDIGCNIIRVKGGMPSPTLCKICDETGMMLLVEPVETWQSADSAEIV
jgi:beta-galactosidase/beta-glucuronidase